MIGVRPQGMFANGIPRVDPTQPQPTMGVGYSGPSAAMPQPAQPSFFGNGGVGRNIAGAIGDYLLQQAHMQPIYAPLQQQARAQTFAQQQYQQHRADAQTDWLAQQEWERANPKPIVNDTVNDYNFRAQTLGEDDAKLWLKRSGDPIVNVTLPGNRFYSGPASGLQAALGAGAAAPAPAPAPPGVTFTPLPAGGAGGSPPARFPSSAVMPALIQAESGGRPGILGPQTQYGRAQGLTQMLPATAKQMANKLGLPWRPDLMTGATPEAAQYQAQLGQAYLEQGMGATGNTRDALRYYHGGPNRAQWGPKTNSYADRILAQLGRN